jgi:hypothetical protein
MRFISHHHKSDFEKWTAFSISKFESKSPYKCLVFCRRRISCRIPIALSLWELSTTYSQHKCGKVDEIGCCLFSLGPFLFSAL